MKNLYQIASTYPSLIKHCNIILCFLIINLLPLNANARQDNLGQIYFFDPDINYVALIKATELLNKYLSQIDNSFNFVPLQNQHDFEKLLNQDRPGFVIINSKLFSTINNLHKITPLLVPSVDNSAFYKKVLVKNTNNILEKSSKLTIAVSGIPSNINSNTKYVFNLIDTSNFNIQNTIILPVSKDIDALLALSFNQVDIALVTNQSFEVLLKINPSAVKQLTVFGTTKPILRSLLCSVNNYNDIKIVNKLTDAFLNMQNNDLGKQILALLGFDNFIKFNTSIREGM
ncbi:MAG: PhnD/SsuA/transferrin family substrate-binding protein [Deltaproteobacteria bacterium]|nr:PhnD/SsuA/transferrin family substrate-binding protein [Deltaproteobacteria bacterium]